MSDIPAVALAGDHVDAAEVRKPTRWHMRRIRNFTIVFGCLSSLFDLLTFAVLFWLVAGVAAPFRTGWLLESLATEMLVLLAIRTRRPLFASSPSRLLLGATLLILVIALLLIELPSGLWLGLVPLPAQVFLAVTVISLAYVATVEIVKRALYRLSEGQSRQKAVRT